VSQCADIVRAVGNPSVRVLYDFYHEQISSGNLIKKLVDNIDLIGLVHIADVPGRHEPGTGEINYRTILRRLVELNFTGTVAMEFLPTAAPIPTLRAAREYAEGILKPRAIVG
jgi:hydroxypyruvate isomerase